MSARVVRGVVAAAAIAMLVVVSRAHWEDSSMLVPVDRLLPQLEARVAAHPNDAYSHYLLGRLHSAAFANACNAIVTDGDLAAFTAPIPPSTQRLVDHVSPTATQRDHFKNDAQARSMAPLDPRASLDHLTQAVEHLSRAVVLAPDVPLYELGLAFVLDSGAHLADQIDPVSLLLVRPLGQATPEIRHEIETCIAALASSSPGEAQKRAEHRVSELLDVAMPTLVAHRADRDAATQATVATLLAREWRELAIGGYLRAHTLGIAADTKDGVVVSELFETLISVEAGRGYLRLVQERGLRGDDERKDFEHVQQVLESMSKAKFAFTALTPIVVPDRPDATLDSLFDGANTGFDLAGIGERQRWPWPRESASFLVWDPECAGSITSGRQLFGSATWWMFFEDGYSALDALDEDGDGWLSGSELESLSLWRDSNRNGVSDAGEVLTLAERGVTALATRADNIDGISPMRTSGVVLADGTTRPTFDWIASPVAQP
jgi:hypothetical protein